MVSLIVFTDNYLRTQHDIFSKETKMKKLFFSSKEVHFSSSFYITCCIPISYRIPAWAKQVMLEGWSLWERSTLWEYFFSWISYHDGFLLFFRLWRNVLILTLIRTYSLVEIGNKYKNIGLEPRTSWVTSRDANRHTLLLPFFFVPSSNRKDLKIRV